MNKEYELGYKKALLDVRKMLAVESASVADWTNERFEKDTAQEVRLCLFGPLFQELKEKTDELTPSKTEQSTIFD